MNYLGTGKLIAYKNYTKDNKVKHVFNVLNGELDETTGLYSKCEYITIVQEEQPLAELKPQNVSFEVGCENFGGKQSIRYMNLRPIK